MLLSQRVTQCQQLKANNQLPEMVAQIEKHLVSRGVAAQLTPAYLNVMVINYLSEYNGLTFEDACGYFDNRTSAKMFYNELTKFSSVKD